MASVRAQTAILSRQFEWVGTALALFGLLGAGFVLYEIGASAPKAHTSQHYRGHVGPFAMSASGEIVGWSHEAARLTGYDGSVVVGKTLASMVRRSVAEEVKQKWEHAVRHSQYFGLDIETASGRAVRVEVCLRGRGTGGWLWGYVAEK